MLVSKTVLVISGSDAKLRNIVLKSANVRHVRGSASSVPARLSRHDRVTVASPLQVESFETGELPPAILYCKVLVPWRVALCRRMAGRGAFFPWGQYGEAVLRWRRGISSWDWHGAIPRFWGRSSAGRQSPGSSDHPKYGQDFELPRRAFIGPRTFDR